MVNDEKRMTTNTDAVVGTLHDATAILGDPAALCTAFGRDGYLFLRGVLDLDLVRSIALRVTGRLAVLGLGVEGPCGLTWSGTGPDAAELRALNSDPIISTLATVPPTVALLDRVFGEPAYVYPRTLLRYCFPADDEYLTAPHQDTFSLRQGNWFVTLWMPLSAIGFDGGPLAVQGASHRLGLLPHEKRHDRFSYLAKGRCQRMVSCEFLSGPWLTAAFRPGDLLMMHADLVHCSLLNLSPFVRLALSALAQPAALPLLWAVSETPQAMAAYASEVMRLSLALGADEDSAEEVLIKMMARGAPAEESIVKTLIADTLSRNR